MLNAYFAGENSQLMPKTDLIRNPLDIRLNEGDELEAIIGNPPGWTLRWGLTLLLLSVVLLLLLSWLIQYPDIVQTRTVLTTQNPPIRLVAGANGRISRFRAANGQNVQAGDLLGVLENPARLDDVLRLEGFLKKLAENDAASYLAVSLPGKLQLGDLQDAYARFSQRFNDLQYFLRQDADLLKISNLRRQIAETGTLNQSLSRQENILAEEVELARRNVGRDSLLLSRKSLSQVEFEQTKSVWLRINRELEALRSGVTQNNLHIRQMEGQILDLQKNQSDTKNERLLSLKADLERLLGDLGNWKQAWLLVAPIAGEVALTKAWSEQQYVRQGEEVLTLVPKESAGRIVGKAFLDSSGSGKVTEGMPVHIRMDGFPYQQFGTLDGTVARIASVPGELGYEVEIALSANMVTDYGKPIPFRQEMQGTARIVAEKRSFLTRILEKIYASLT